MAEAHSQIAEIISDLQAAEKRLFELGSRTNDDNWNIPSRPGSWSIGECIEHLNMTSRAFIPLIRDALTGVSAAGSSKSFKRDLAGYLLSKMVGPLRRIAGARLGAVKTTAEFEPKDAFPKDQSMFEFSKLQTELVHLIIGSERKPLSELKIVSPFGGKLHYNLYSAYTILPRHQHRHLQQAESVWQ